MEAQDEICLRSLTKRRKDWLPALPPSPVSGFQCTAPSLSLWHSKQASHIGKVDDFPTDSRVSRAEEGWAQGLTQTCIAHKWPGWILRLNPPHQASQPWCFPRNLCRNLAVSSSAGVPGCLGREVEMQCFIQHNLFFFKVLGIEPRILELELCP
jgi:hypothetical protein